MAISFDTVFKIGALFTGQAAINQAQNAVGTLEKQGLLANLSFKKLVGTVTGIAAGWFTVDKLTGFIGSSIDAARKAKTAYQGMYDSLSKVPGLQKLGTQVIKEQTDKVNDLAKQMEKAGGLASETLLTAFTQLTEKGFSPAKVKDMSAAFQDVIVRVAGVKASADDAAKVAQRFGDAVITGGRNGADALISMGIITEEQRQKFENLQTTGGRYNYVLEEMGKKTGDTAEAMKTMDGVQVRMQNQWKNVKIAIGTPFVQAQDALTGAMDKIKETLLNSATKVGDTAVPALSNAIGRVNTAMSETAGKMATTLTPILTKVTDTMSDFIVKHPQFAAATTVTVAAVGGFAALPAIAGKINSFAGAIKEVHGAFKLITSINVGSIIGLMTNPAFWVVAGIAAFAAAIYLLVTHWDDVKKAAIACWNAIQSAWGTAATWVDTNIIQPIVNLFGAFVSKIKVGDLWGAFLEWGNIWQKIDSAILQMIINLFPGLVPKILPMVGKLEDAFKVWESITNWVSEKIIDPIVNYFKGLPAKVGEALSSMGAAIYNAIVGQVKKLPGGPMILGMLGLKEGSIALPTGPAATAATLGAAGPAAAAGGTPITGLGGGPIQITHYGYEKRGEADWDANSARGIGAYNNQLVPGYDVALNRPSAAMVGVDYDRGLGSKFAYQNNTFRYADRMSERLTNPRIDIYDPSGTLVKAQLGGIMAKPGLAMLAERVPEMAIPLERTAGSRGLLSAAAAMISPGFGRQMGGGGGPTSVSVAPVINITAGGGVDAGQIGREVERAMRDPVRSLLEQLKKAKQHEARLAYV